MTASEVVDRLLADQTYHIEFNGHLTNHAKHAVVALAGLGASPEKIKAYYDNYAKLTPYGYGLEAQRPVKRVISAADWDQFLGKRVHFASYCAFFDRQVAELGLDEVLRRYLPRLLPGWVGSFTHATIHLGWALDAGSRWMAVEGLAYLSFSYVSCHPERTGGNPVRDERAVDSLLRIAGVWEDDRDALRRWAQTLIADTAAGIHPELARSGLQYRIARMLNEGHPLIHQTPSWINEQDVTTSWEQLYYVVTLLYLAMPGDFVLLHLITSLHAMEQIADRMPAEQRQAIVRQFWIGMLCVVFAEANFPTRTKLAALHSTFEDAVDAGGPQVWDSDWRQIVARAVEEEEEHNPKLVYVLRRVWRLTGGRTIYRAAASQFTATPQLPPSFEEPPTE
ncbi:MAG: questin oxidase family protein [Pseudonocardiaceae bacterium]